MLWSLLLWCLSFTVYTAWSGNEKAGLTLYPPLPFKMEKIESPIWCFMCSVRNYYFEIIFCITLVPCMARREKILIAFWRTWSLQKTVQSGIRGLFRIREWEYKWLWRYQENTIWETSGAHATGEKKIICSRGVSWRKVLINYFNNLFHREHRLIAGAKTRLKIVCKNLNKHPMLSSPLAHMHPQKGKMDQNAFFISQNNCPEWQLTT